MQLVIKISDERYKEIVESDKPVMIYRSDVAKVLANGIPLTPNVLADLLMEERIRGELKQDISYSKDIIDDVRCKLTVDIIDHRPCYCGAELREVWRESEDKE